MVATQQKTNKDFHTEFDYQLALNRDTAKSLHRQIVFDNESFNVTTLTAWRRGAKIPRTAVSFQILTRIEQLYLLPAGHFKSLLPTQIQASYTRNILATSVSQTRRLAWHLPDDLQTRPEAEQQEILEWANKVMISGSTDYRKFHSAASKVPYALAFPGYSSAKTKLRNAPQRLAEELEELVRFKTEILTPVGYFRNGVWCEKSARQKVEHLGLLFGALSSTASSSAAGPGVPEGALTLGLLAVPAIWDWYIQWRAKTRGFYTNWEVDMLHFGLAMTRKETGWLRQNPEFAMQLIPVPDLVSEQDIASARENWDLFCDTSYKRLGFRSKEIERIARIHRDPFEPILAVLESDSPLTEYRKIADEILRLMPDEQRYPKSAAESVRSFLMIRLGLHSGLRQKNLRELLVCPRGNIPKTEKILTDLRRGELRWNDLKNAWEIFIPAIAFKNAGSSFFNKNPFRLCLPDMAGLYDNIDSYLCRHRRILLGDLTDPGNFFIKTAKSTIKNAAYDQTSFYVAWRSIIQRYGIYNPYTGRGVIKGLLPHGPHCVRDVLATHILKQTGSYEHASYAIQDTPEMVAKHYGRFLPQHKTEFAAQILNKIWLN